MSTNLDIIKAHYAGSDTKDMAAMLAPLTATTRWTEMAGFPCAGTFTGREEIFTNVFAALGAMFDNYTFTLERLLDSGADVIDIGDYAGTAKITGKINCEFIYGTKRVPDSLNSLSLNKTPAQTTTNANKVPMLAKSVTSVRFINSAGIATTQPVTIVANQGV